MKKLRYAARLALHGLVGAAVLMTIPWLIGAARAATGDAPVVPPPTPDAIIAYVQAYGWIIGALTVVYVGGKWLLEKNQSTHWIAQGRALAMLTTVVGVGGTALQAWTSGTPWSGVLATAVLGLLHLADAQGPARNPQAGMVGGNMMAGLGILGAIVMVVGGLFGWACTAAQRTQVEHALWDCTAPARADAVAAVTPAVISVIKAAGSADGKAIDLSTVKSAITKANLMSEAGVLLSCAMASAVAILMAPAPPPVAGAAAAEPFVLDPAAVRATWDAVKRDQLGGADFRVAGGAVL